MRKFCILTRFAFAAAMVIVSNISFAQKAKDFSVVIQELAAKLEAARMPAQPLRLAVVPFGNTQSRTSNKFGEYITESIIGKLSDNPGKYKIFERRRLDAILKEDELILSDLMLPEGAQKIGKLAPIDALFSGTYTRLKTYIDISARLMDVTSGEILVSFSGRVKMTRNLRSLFPDSDDDQPAIINNNNQSATGVVVLSEKDPVSEKSMAEICKERVQQFEAKLNDLSTQEKIDAIVKDAVAVPFDNQCGAIHYNVMYSFLRYKIYRPEYESFLLATLDTIAFPTSDDRTYEIVRFMASDSIIDAKEWREGLTALSRMGDYHISTFIAYLLGRTKSTEGELHSRLDEYFDLVNKGKAGLPTPIHFSMAFFEVMEGLRSNQPLRQYVYEKYSKSVPLDARSSATVYSELHSMYEEEPTPVRKTVIINWVADFFNKYSDEKSHDHLYDMARSFELTSNESRNKEISQDFPASDLKVLVDKCKARFSEYAMKTPYKSQQEDRIEFCVVHGIPIPGVIPTFPEADVILKGNDLNEQLRVMKLLVMMGATPKELEPTLIKLLSKRSLDEKEKLSEIQSLSLQVLGHIKTSNNEVIELMTSKLVYYSNESDSATAALIAIGKPSVAPLVRMLSKTTDQDGGLRYKIVVILGTLGTNAKSAEPALKKLMTENQNADVRYAIEAALQAIH